MSDVDMPDAEPADDTNKEDSPPPFRFLLPPGIWSMCQWEPFRFLDLPPELRNRIYEQAFTGSHGLSPHHLTQVNRQIRAESARMFHEQTHTLQIPLQTPKEMTRFLNWVESDAADLLPTKSAYEFTYTDIDLGVTTVRFTQAVRYPKTVLQWIRNYSPETSDEDAISWAWYLLLGMDYRMFAADFGELFYLFPPPSDFIDAIDNDSAWDYYTMDFIGEPGPALQITNFYAQQIFAHFIGLLTAMANEEWSEKMLRNIAGFLYMRSMQAGTKKVRQI